MAKPWSPSHSHVAAAIAHGCRPAVNDRSSQRQRQRQRQRQLNQLNDPLNQLVICPCRQAASTNDRFQVPAPAPVHILRQPSHTLYGGNYTDTETKPNCISPICQCHGLDSKMNGGVPRTIGSPNRCQLPCESRNNKTIMRESARARWPRRHSQERHRIWQRTYI